MEKAGNLCLTIRANASKSKRRLFRIPKELNTHLLRRWAKRIRHSPLYYAIYKRLYNLLPTLFYSEQSRTKNLPPGHEEKPFVFFVVKNIQVKPTEHYHRPRRWFFKVK